MSRSQQFKINIIGPCLSNAVDYFRLPYSYTIHPVYRTGPRGEEAGAISGDSEFFSFRCRSPINGINTYKFGAGHIPSK